MKVFTPRAVRALAPRIEGLVEELLGPALERGSAFGMLDVLLDHIATARTQPRWGGPDQAALTALLASLAAQPTQQYAEASHH